MSKFIKIATIIPVVLIVFSVCNVFSQVTVNQDSIFEAMSINEKYDYAMDLYTRGKIDTAMNFLRPNLKRGKLRKANKGTRANFYRLASQSCILLEKPKEAKKHAKRLLSYEPNYEGTKNDLRKFSIMLSKLHTIPKFMIGVKGGVNTSIVNVKTQYSYFEIDENVVGSSSEPAKYNSSKELTLGYQFGITGGLALTRNIYAIFEPTYLNQKFQYEVKYTDALEENVFTQKINYFEIPLGARFYFFPRIPYRPYIQAGIQYQLRLSAYKLAGSSNVPVTKNTNSKDQGYYFGAGMSFNTKKYAIGLDLKYVTNMSSVYLESKRYLIDGQSDVFVFKNYDIADDYTLQNIQLSFNFVIFLSHKVF